MSNETISFRGASRRALLGKEYKRETPIPGSGTSAASAPERHVRVKITMNIDGDLLEHFKKRAEKYGRSYQLLINEALREHLEGSKKEKLAGEVGELLLSDDSFVEAIASRVALLDSPT